MKLWMHLLAAGLAWTAIGRAAAADRPLREAESENARFCLRIRPGRPGFDAVRGCKATFFERSKERHRAKKRWERFLVNDVAPAIVCIRNDGRFVVTLDEFRQGGARHALVVYGERGELLRHFLLPDLLEKEDWKHVKVQKRSLDWLGGAKLQFVDEPPRFVITLKHGRQIGIDLRTLDIARSAEGRAGAALDWIPLEIVAALFGEEATGEQRAERGSTASPEEYERVAAMAEALAGKAEESAGDGEAEVAAADAPAVEVEQQPGAGAASAEPGAGEPVAAAAKRESAEEPAQPGDKDAEAAALAESDAPFGIAVPRPDPAEPFDYLAWLNEMALTEGPNAAADYRAAMDTLVRWEGDSALLKAALTGDPEALASPELQNWLDANREAVAYFRSGTELEFRGWQMHSEDGSLLSVRLPQLSSLRQLGRAVVVEGQYLAAEGFVEDAADNHLDVLTVGAQVSHGPTMIENLVGIAVQAPAAEALLDLQARDGAADVDYVRLAERVAEAYQPTRPMGEALQFERAAFMDTLQNMYDYDSDTGQYVLNTEEANKCFGLAGQFGQGPADRDALLRQQMAVGFEEMVEAGNACYDALTEAWSLPYAQSVARLEEIYFEVNEGPETSPLMRAMTPTLARVRFVETRAETLRRAAQLVVNLHAHRQQYGVYPDTLEVLGDSDFAADPFTNGRFRYRREGADFVLYSLGGNGTDDAGVHDPKAETNDYVFWPRPRRED